MTGYVYFFESSDGSIKIGATSNVESRFKTLKTACPTGLKNIGSIKDDDPFKLEKRLHQRFKQHRKSGEWFDICSLQALSIIKAHEKGFHKHDADSIAKSLIKLKEIAELITKEPMESQNPSKFYEYEDLELLSESIREFKKHGMTRSNQTLCDISEMAIQRLYLLLNSNAWEKPELIMQHIARDVLGFINVYQSFVSTQANYDLGIRYDYCD